MSSVSMLNPHPPLFYCRYPLCGYGYSSANSAYQKFLPIITSFTYSTVPYLSYCIFPDFLTHSFTPAHTLPNLIPHMLLAVHPSTSRYTVQCIGKELYFKTVEHVLRECVEYMSESMDTLQSCWSFYNK